MKGFVRTLEAVISATVMLGIALNVAPQLSERPSDASPSESVYSSLESLRDTGELSSLNRSEVEQQVSGSVPAGFEHRALAGRTGRRTDRVALSGTRELDYDREGEDFALQLIVDSADTLNASYNGTLLVDNATGKGYLQNEVPTGNATLQLNGTAKLHATLYNFSTDGTTPDSPEVFSVNFPLSEDLREVRLLLWKDRSS